MRLLGTLLEERAARTEQASDHEQAISVTIDRQRSALDRELDLLRLAEELREGLRTGVDGGRGLLDNFRRLGLRPTTAGMAQVHQPATAGWALDSKADRPADLSRAAAQT